MNVLLTRRIDGSLIPINDEENDKLSKFGPGDTVRANIIRFKNATLFRQWFVLLQIGFNLWHPTDRPRMFRGQEIRMQFEQFREEITILAGFYDVSYSLDGQEMRLHAKSVAWDKMNDEDFEKLYGATIDVLLNKVFKDPDMTKQKLETWVQTIIEFDRTPR